MNSLTRARLAHRWEYAKFVTKESLWNSDTVTIRVILASASLFFALALIGNSHMFDRPSYEVMKQYGTEYCWAFAFFIHWLGVYWRLLDPMPRPHWALVVNTFGFTIWALMTLSINVALGSITPGTTLEWTMVAWSGLALYRTGLNKESLTP